MSIKDLFGKKSNKIVTKEQADKIADEVESYEFISENQKTKKKYIPKIDYAEPKNFAKYGSAAKYYEDSIEHIYKTFPYDGSGAEKSKWFRESSPLDIYILDQKYPKAVGHILLNGEATLIDTIEDLGFGKVKKYESPQYIYIKGGPNKDSRVKEGDEYELSKQFPAKGGRANIWSEDYFRESNLGINPSVGNSIEFWMKFGDTEAISSGHSICLFDLWNGKSHSDDDYVRFMVEMLPETGSDFSITYKYGSDSEGVERVGFNISDSTIASIGADYLLSWNHYSFTVQSVAEGMEISLYVNGILQDTGVIAGKNIVSDIPQENYFAFINGYTTVPTSTSPVEIEQGTGGSEALYIDEFRFWKKKLTGRDIGRYWFTSVTGGTNTDNSKYNTSDNVDIGVYYKFNEGLLNSEEIDSQDAVVLDYSGRISNGQIINYSLNVRRLTSAIDEATVTDEFEPSDPIIYSNNLEIISLKKELYELGLAYDTINNSAMYNTMPQWILEEDEENAQRIKELTQALSSYFDSLHLQIEALTSLKQTEYYSLIGKADNPYYFASNLLRSVGFDVSDIFTEATVLEEIASRGEKELFDIKIQDVKNTIYQNIYNNLSYIYKSKGTEKSFRNLIRCFGVDDELIKLNLYADGVDYTLDGRRSFTSVKKNYADFNHPDRQEGIVYISDESLSSSNEREFIKGTTVEQSQFLKSTLTAEVIFPKQLSKEHPLYVTKDFTEVSLFGTKEADVIGGVLNSYSETAENIGSFRVFAIKPDRESINAKFKLIYTDADGNHELLTEEYKDVYDNTKWNFAVRIKPVDADLADFVAGSEAMEYIIDFYGVSANLDTIQHEFKLSASYSGEEVIKAQAMVASDKLVYCGHLRSNLSTPETGLAKSDVKITDVMYWFDYLADEEIKIHAIDASSVGRLHPNDDSYAFFSELSDGSTTDIRVPAKDTLALHWSFQNVTSSDSNSEFVVYDSSVGGSDYIAKSRYGWFTDLIGFRHQGKGSFDPAFPNDERVISREYQYTAVQKLPEVLSGDDMVEIRTQDDNLFIKGSKPINHFFAIEKSMSQVISSEMMNFFASIVEFNDLIGQPVNRYRMQYKSLAKFRSLFYENVKNTPSFEKYVEFYKWLDSSLGLMLQQMIPASGNFSESMRNMVENHVLERSKYWTKFPTLEKNQDPPEGTIRGIRELTYDWEHGHAPDPDVPVNEDEYCLWRNERAIRDDSLVTSGDESVDADRESIRKAAVRDVLGQTRMVKVGTDGFVEQGKPRLYDSATSSMYEGSTYATRRLSRPYKLNLDKANVISGGPNFADATVSSTNDTLRAATSIGHSVQVDAAGITDANICRDEFQSTGGPINKKRRAHQVILIDIDGVEKKLKGSLLSSPLYGQYPNDDTNEFVNIHHDSYGQDHEVPLQGPFTNQWVGGNQHRHIDLNTGSDNENVRPELYKFVANIIKNPFDVAGAANPSGVYASARYTRDGMAKRPVNISNVKSSLEQINLGNYTYDYEVVQTSGRSNNNRWLARNSDYILTTGVSDYVDGLWDFELPDRTTDSNGKIFGRTEHVFVERFSAPGSPDTMARGSLDKEAEEFSPYNSMNYRNIKERTHLNFWHKEHARRFGYRDDYIHGTIDDEIAGESNDFGGNTPAVASWHKNNRNPQTRMDILDWAFESSESDRTHTSKKQYDNFFVSHQIPRSSWQYNWITASSDYYISNGESLPVSVDDEHKDITTPTELNKKHMRLSGFFGTYENTSVEPNFILSASLSLTDSTSLDFVYGNSAIIENVDVLTQTVGSSCGSYVCDYNLRASLLNRNGPYQGAGWKFLKGAENPIIRKQRVKSQLSVEDPYVDGRSVGTHTVYIEPYTTWNMPIRHIIEEEKDKNGIRVTHSYSNNLEGFANPRLTKRLRFVKTNEQYYDRILEDLGNETKGINFIGISYKEYIFPKHRNVGLAKTRERLVWDIVSPSYIVDTKTGSVRIFWKDSKISRIKDRKNLIAVNAVGYRRSFGKNHLGLLSGVHSEPENSVYGRSIFSMDNFEVTDDDGNTVLYLGDLQFVGKENYFQHILSNQKGIQYGNFITQSEPDEATGTGFVSYLGVVEDNPIKMVGKETIIVDSLKWSAMPTIDVEKPSDYKSQFDLITGTSESLVTSLLDGQVMTADTGVLTKIAENVSIYNKFLAVTRTPEPVVQLYYNPFNISYQEGAWLYRASYIAGKNPWINSYSDFSLQSRAMAQNYGIVAEFRVSEHMDKYIIENGGDFKSSVNYNFLTLEGSAYNGIDYDSPVAGETKTSGNVKIISAKGYYYSDKYSSKVEKYPSSYDEALESIVTNNAFSSATIGNSTDDYDEYNRYNQIWAGGNQRLENCDLTSFIGESEGIYQNFRDAVSWKYTEEDDGTGRCYSSTEENITNRKKFISWEPVQPNSFGRYTSMMFNMAGEIEYLDGNINRRIADSSEGGSYAEGLKIRHTMATEFISDIESYKGATPITVSIWAKPKGQICEDTGKQLDYDGKIKGLFVFGDKKEEYTFEDIILYSNFPAPSEIVTGQYVEKYSNGMGLTLHIKGLYEEDTNTDAERNIYHFFTGSGKPAVMEYNQWSHVAMQIIPFTADARPMKFKMWLNGQALYGIHRKLLTSPDFENVGYTVLPYHNDVDILPWGELYYSPIVLKVAQSSRVYRLGLSTLHNYIGEKVQKYEGAELTNPDLYPYHELAKVPYSKYDIMYPFSGEMCEFSIWQGIASTKDIVTIFNSRRPSNILEDFINGEVLGGYTTNEKLDSEWGSNSSKKTFSNLAPLSSSPAEITYTPFDAGIITPEMSRAKFNLIAWHRLGVSPSVIINDNCEDWDDAFFDSYVHTDVVRFYDNVVEDYDLISNTAKKKIKLKVNALKRLIPYRGFYPQDRTLQLASLYANKMQGSIDFNGDAGELHQEQKMQAALQPFFAPGILYNTIKAGIAVDWPAFTNESGMEPHKAVLQSVTLPDGDVRLLSNVAPNWYLKRKEEYNSIYGLMDSGIGEEDPTAVDTLNVAYESLKKQQPKHTASQSKSDLGGRGYVILSEPNLRIPFEGLVSLDSVLPTKTSNESVLKATKVSDKAFKHFDLEISGWDAEGVEIRLSQLEPKNGYSSFKYPSSKDFSFDNYTISNKSITIGDSSIDGTEYDIDVNFRRAPVGWSLHGETSEYGETSIVDLNTEIAIKLCREINKRSDIHFVAIPGSLGGFWKYGDEWDPDGKVSDDYLAKIFPAVHPEIFGFQAEDINPENTAQPYSAVLNYQNLSTGTATLGNDYFGAGGAESSSSKLKLGNQGNGTWRIRLVYVGLPLLELDLAGVDIGKTNYDSSAVGWLDGNAPSELEKLSLLPYNDTTILSENPEKRINSQPTIGINPLVKWSSTGKEPVGKSSRSYANGLATNQLHIAELSWKEMHVVCPFTYNGDTPVGMGVTKTYWNQGKSGAEVSGIPHSFFDGGNWLMNDKGSVTLSDGASVTLTRHLGAIRDSKWVSGFGWFGFPKFSVDTELGVRYVSESGSTVKAHFNDVEKVLTYPNSDLADIVKSSIATISGDASGNNTFQLSESDKPFQGPFRLYGGISSEVQEVTKVTKKPYQIYLMTPEYYVESQFEIEKGMSDTTKGLALYKYPYFEYNGSNGDPRFEMAMHNFLAEVPNFFLKDSKLTSFNSKPEKEFKTMEAGKTYYMDVSMEQTDYFSTLMSPHSNESALAKPRLASTTGEMTFEGRYYGPAFRWKDLEDYNHETIDRDLVADPAQAPYVPPYLYGKSIARISFTANQTKKYSLEEILAGAEVNNVSSQQINRFINSGASSEQSVTNSPAWRARMTISSSMNLFGKAFSRDVEYSAQIDKLTDDVEQSIQKFVPQVVKDSQGSDSDIWTIGTKFECPVLNFYSAQIYLDAMETNKAKPEVRTTDIWRGTGIWSGYGNIPQVNQGIFIGVEESFKESGEKVTGGNIGSLLDVCGFEPSNKKVGQISEQKEISEAVVMIPFVDSPSDTSAETIRVGNRNFFKINKDLFSLQKNNIEKGRDAVGAGQWEGIQNNIPETSISKMIKGMKKYNLPPLFDFIRFPLRSSESPFVMYIFEFHHILSRQDLADIWQGLPPKISTVFEHDSSMFAHELGPVDFFEENTLPKNVRWMTFKVKKRANDNYYKTTTNSFDDQRFEFDFEYGKSPPKYNYNWPYDYFTMLEMIQVEAGIDIVESKKVILEPTSKKNEEIISDKDLKGMISSFKNISGEK